MTDQNTAAALEIRLELEQFFGSPFSLFVPSQQPKGGSLQQRVPEISCHPEVEGLLIRPLGIRFSMQKLSFYDRILSIPLYMVRHWERIVKSITPFIGDAAGRGEKVR